MGFRTVVVLNNDRAHEWGKDENLGRKILEGIHDSKNSFFPYGEVAECVHADTVTLAKISFYGKFEPMGYGVWDDVDQNLHLLQQAASKLGYDLVKKG